MSDAGGTSGVLSGHRIEVRGGASAEEIAAVLALVAGRPARSQDDPLQRWRRLRQAVTKPT